MTDRYLIVGLGNPGREYEKNRHNIGFRAVDAIAAAYGLNFDKRQSKAVVADGIVAEKKVLLAKPQTYMNVSGDSVSGLIAFYKIPLPNLIVISDDMDISAGTLRIREKGSSGGQKGLKHIIERLGSQEVARVRLGVGRPPGRMDPAAYLLQDFSKDEEAELPFMLDRVVKAIEVWLRQGLPIMMTRYNGTTNDAPDNVSRNTNKSANTEINKTKLTETQKKLEP